MALKLGDKSITNIYVGDKSIVNIYMGEKLIYSKDNGGGESTSIPYLEQTAISGRTRIDIKYTPTNTSRYEIGFLPDLTKNWTTNKHLFGGWNSSSSAYGLAVYLTKNSSTSYTINWKHGSTTNNNKTIEMSNNKMQVVTLSKDEFTVNGVDYTGTQATPSLKYGLFLFNTQQSGSTPSTNTAFIGRIYYFKVYEGDTLVRDLIAHLDDAGKPCMMDTLTGTCYYESGTTGYITYGE